MMIYQSQPRGITRIHELAVAAELAGDLVISDWVSGARLCSQSGWMENWITARFKEGIPDLPRWLRMLRTQQAMKS